MGNDLAVNLNLEPKALFASASKARTLMMRVMDKVGANSGWETKGAWQINP